jgi:hypothetical protein
MDMRRLDRATLARRRRGRRRRVFLRWLVVVVCLAVVALVVLLVLRGCGGNSPATGATGQTTTASSGQAGGSTTSGSSSSSTQGSNSTTGTEAGFNMTVAAVQGTRPVDFGMSTKLFHGSSTISSFNRSTPVDFGPGSSYTSLPGIITFRGNNFRDSASYGTADVQSAKLSLIWSVPTGSVAKPGGAGAWTGSGWTGQPLIVQWPDALKQIMNIKDSKKAEPDLTEVIYPCLDGKIYFLDLKDGTSTRSPISSGGGPFKGTGSIYPSGIPLLFVGHGDNSPGKQSVRARLYSLIDQKQLYTFGTSDPQALRKWTAYDSSALFDVNSGTLIEPGENGLLYTIRLNPQFDQAAGTISIDPGLPIKARYAAPDYADGGANTPSTRWWGMEDSAVAWRNYIFVADNGGRLFCWDVNTMKLIWVQDVLDDTNTTPVFEESPQDGTGYLYISTSLHLTATGSKDPRKGGIPIWKINAATGQIVWETDPYPCYTISDVSGGVQSTPVLGEKDISNLVIYNIARTPSVDSGIVVALDKKTGQEVWKTSLTHYSWSSPVAIYTPAGKSYIVVCDSVGTMHLLEGTTGKELDALEIGANTEASPAVFNDTIVVGTRGQRIVGVKIK